jgi:hypothetical protein
LPCLKKEERLDNPEEKNDGDKQNRSYGLAQHLRFSLQVSYLAAEMMIGLGLVIPKSL